MQFNQETLLKGIAGIYFNNLKRTFTAEIKKNFESIMFMVESDPTWTDPRHIAYFLATIAYETRWTFQPLKEFRAKPGNPAYELQNRYWGSGYYGRGFIQLTWRSNYEKFTRLLGINLLANPDLAYQASISYKIASIGMRRGVFTGKKLSDYISQNRQDYVGARQIVNGKDQDKFIASLAKLFEGVIMRSQIKLEATTSTIMPMDVSPGTSVIPPIPDAPSSSATYTVSSGDEGDRTTTISTISNDTVDIVREIPTRVNGLKTWKTAILGVLGAVGSGLAAIFAWLRDGISNPSNLKYVAGFVALSIIIATVFAVAHMFTRAGIVKERERLAHELTLKELELRADPTKNNVRAR